VIATQGVPLIRLSFYPMARLAPSEPVAQLASASVNWLQLQL
jgi:hypothetical protein